jgi:hypothetical protein
MKEVLETTRYVIEQSRHVTIDEDALYGFSQELLASGADVPPWDCHYHYCGDEEKTISYLLVLDTLNFCFWAMAGDNRWEILYESKPVSGYFGLAAALKSALEFGVPITTAPFLSEMTAETLRDVLGGTGTLPLFDERVHVLKELGQILLTEYAGRAVNLVEDAGGSAVRLACLLACKLSSFRDVAFYEGREVFFYKRAQIFASDLHGAFDGKSWGRFSDIDKLTAFADYKLPQVLRHMGILQYDKDLAEKIESQELIDSGSAEEVEIRANTVWAVELIRQALGRKGRPVTASQIDWMLWNLGQDDPYRARHYHRTLTVFY